MFIYYIFAQGIQSKINFRKANRFVRRVFIKSEFKSYEKEFSKFNNGVFYAFLLQCFQ